MTLTKTDNILAVARTGLSKKQSSRAVNTLLEIIKHSLEQGEDVVIRGFGKFRVCEGKGFNTRISGHQCFVPPGSKRIVVFRCSPALGSKINGRE